jgi:hypothetical protein
MHRKVRVGMLATACHLNIFSQYFPSNRRF